MNETCLLCDLPILELDRKYDRVTYYNDGEVHIYCRKLIINVIPECPLNGQLESSTNCNLCCQALDCVQPGMCGCGNLSCQIGKSIRALRKNGLIAPITNPQYLGKSGYRISRFDEYLIADLDKTQTPMFTHGIGIGFNVQNVLNHPRGRLNPVETQSQQNYSNVAWKSLQMMLQQGINWMRKLNQTQTETLNGAALGKLMHNLQASQYKIGDTEKWIKTNESQAKSLVAKNVIEFVERNFDYFDDQLYILKVMAEISYRNKLDSLTEYTFAIHKLVKKTYYDHEMVSFYGTALWAAKLLPDYIRTIFLHDLFVNFLENSSTYLSDAWWPNIVLRDITRHLIVCQNENYRPYTTIKGRGITEVHVEEVNGKFLQKALEVIRWDVPYLDLVVFYAYLTRESQLLVEVLPLLKKGIRENTATDRRISIPTLPIQPNFRTHFHSKLQLRKIDDNEIEYADNRENNSRIGLLLRIGEYLTFDENEKIREYGEQLRASALKYLDSCNSEISNKIRSLNAKKKKVFFHALETMDSRKLEQFFPKKHDLTKVYQLLCQGCSQYDTRMNTHLPISIEFEV